MVRTVRNGYEHSCLECLESEDNQISQMIKLEEGTKYLESKNVIPGNVFKSEDKNQIGTKLD